MTKKNFLSRAARAVLLAAPLICFAATPPPASAGGPVVWETNSRAELLTGEARGVSITDTGAVMLAPRFTQLFDTEQAYVWSSAIDASGAVYLGIGTGDAGKLYRVRAAGAKPESSVLVDINETHVISLALDRQGTLVAGTD